MGIDRKMGLFIAIRFITIFVNFVLYVKKPT